MIFWVFEANQVGWRFYNVLNGHIVERKNKELPGGASVPSLRYLWRDTERLLNDLTAPTTIGAL